MAKKIIILEKLDNPRLSYNYLLWVDVPVARQPYHANVNAESKFVNATAQEVQDIKDGKIVERQESIQLENTSTVGEAMTILQSRWTTFQVEINNEKKYDRFGSYWDGTSWTQAGA